MPLDVSILEEDNFADTPWPYLAQAYDLSRRQLYKKLGHQWKLNPERNNGLFRNCAAPFFTPAANGSGHQTKAKKPIAIAELGCGKYSPFGIAAQYFLNGVDHVYACDFFIEPALPELAARDIYELAARASLFPEQYVWHNTQAARTALRQRIKRLPLKALEQGDWDVFKHADSPLRYFTIDEARSALKPNSLNYIYSVAVIEHIRDLDTELQFYFNLLRQGSKMKMLAGIEDHRFLDGQADMKPWSYMIDGNYGAQANLRADIWVNGLRPSQILAKLKNAGFELLEQKSREIYPNIPDNLAQLVRPEFAALPESDLRTNHFDFVVLKP